MKRENPSGAQAVAGSGENRGSRRLASTIVTPSHQLPPQEENITFRGKNVALALTFSPQAASGGVENDQVIGALEDMEILDTTDAGMMDCDAQDDDLLADEVMDMEEQAKHLSVAHQSEVRVAPNNKKSSRSGIKRNAPLGIQSKNKEFLRQGSPRARSVKPSGGSKLAENGKPRRSQPTLQHAQCQPTSSNAAPGRGRGRGRHGRPPERGQARKVTVPRGQGVYMCPFTDRVFECFGSTARDCGGSSSKETKSRK
ncbi:hypothetical protein Bca52824_058424 [Brassica carinata]|uniref:Uncharacterized protein n=1 Tax=Brassica carinata TaxID=52824 RepID=A0A8X7QSF4_BRACI|nr:hypothetical protein Bca52824_058424 [Brassica carinata]